MRYGEPNPNEGKPWSEMDLLALKNGRGRGTPIAGITAFLCRSKWAVREKIVELQRRSSGNLVVVSGPTCR